MGKHQSAMSFKNKIVELSDELYIVSSLGKILFDVSMRKVNELIGTHEVETSKATRTVVPLKDEYEEIEFSGKEAATRLVTTVRLNPKAALFEYSRRMLSYLSPGKDYRAGRELFSEEKFIMSDVHDIPNVIYEFDLESQNRFAEVNEESPYLTGNSEELMRYLGIRWSYTKSPDADGQSA